MSATARILFVYMQRSSFVRGDIEILRGEFAVRELPVRSPFRPLPWEIVAAVMGSDLVFCWFTSWHAVLPLVASRLFGRPSILVVGGYDVASVPEIGYGHQRGGVRKLVARLAMRLATRVCPFSLSAEREAERNAQVSRDRITMIPLGVEAGPEGTNGTARGPLVITVGDVNRSNLRRKGLDRFARASRAMPEFTFVIAGAIQDDSAEELVRLGRSDLTLTGRLGDEELADLYRRAAVYLQLSVHEGFGMAVAEAMLAGCVPVVTRVGSLPELVGDAGEYVDDPAPEAVAAAVRRALADPTRGTRAAERIRSCFPFSKRRERLSALVHETLRARG